MNKRIKILLLSLAMILPGLLLAVTGHDNPLGDAQGAISSVGNLIATLMVVVVVSIWLLPMILAFMVFTNQKKKAEQQHEDTGLKAAGLALVAAILGTAASYYIVGSIGMATDDSVSDLKAGNAVFLKPIMGTGVKNISGQGFTQEGNAADGANDY